VEEDGPEAEITLTVKGSEILTECGSNDVITRFTSEKIIGGPSLMTSSIDGRLRSRS
jgi:hypothetical protein